MRKLLILLLFLCANVCYAQVKEPINRTWTSIAGTKVDAELVSFNDREVVLKLKDGKTIKLRLDKLAEYDRYFVKGLERVTVPEGGIKSHQLEVELGNKSNKLIHYLNKKRFSGIAYKMRVNPDADLFLEDNDEAGYTNNVWETQLFKNGVLNGPHKQIWQNGQKNYEVESYSHNVKKIKLSTRRDSYYNGLYIEWDKTGKIIKVKTYKDGEVVKGSAKFWNNKGEPVDSIEEAYKE